MFGKVARNGDIISYYQIAKFAFFLVNRKAFAFQTDFGSVLGFRFYFQFYLAVQCTPEEEKMCNEAYAYVMQSSADNRAIIFSELHSQLNKTRQEAEALVDKMDDSNAKKWYLKGLLWSEEAGKEPPVGIADDGFRELSDVEFMKLQNTDPAAAVKYTEALERHAKLQEVAGTDRTPFFLAYFQHS